MAESKTREMWALDKLKFWDKNPRAIHQQDFERLKKQILKHKQYKPLLINQDGIILGGNMRYRAMQDLGVKDVWVSVVETRNESEMLEYALSDNDRVGHYLEQELAELLHTNEIEQALYKVDLGRLSTLEQVMEQVMAGPTVSLAERFLVPPFSVLDARQEYWQERKRAWINLGINSEAGRGESLLRFSPLVELNGGSSIFDPVLCELAYRWFTPPNGMVLDPFAGGSVRGIVAAKTGRQYTGVDLRAEQVEANQQQAETICSDHTPIWITGDSRQLPELTHTIEADFIFSCPPYGDLEQYSDDPKDLSNSSYEQFMADYRAIITLAVNQLKQDRFACFVVGDFRDKHGFYRNFVSNTIQAFEDAGCRLYNEAILVTAVGSLPMRVKRQFVSARKLGKTHQNVLVFVKGDPKRATTAVGLVELDDALFTASPQQN